MIKKMIVEKKEITYFKDLASGLFYCQYSYGYFLKTNDGKVYDIFEGLEANLPENIEIKTISLNYCHQEL